MTAPPPGVTKGGGVVGLYFASQMHIHGPPRIMTSVTPPPHRWTFHCFMAKLK